MNKRDRKEFEEQLKNTEFNKLYDEFTVLLLSIQLLAKKNKVAMTAEVPMAHELKEGKQTRLLLSGKRANQIKPVIQGLYRQVESRARSLSAFFPSDQRWQWQEIFISQAFHGHGVVGQRQHGGRRLGRCETAKQERRRMAEDYWETVKHYRDLGEKFLTQNEFVDARREEGKYSSISVSTLKRALREYNQTE